MTITQLQVSIRILASLAGAAAGNLTPSTYLDSTTSLSFTSGVAAGACDTVVSINGTLAASGATTLDLVGALTDAFGVSVSMIKMRGFILINNTAAGTDGRLRFKSTSTAPFALQMATAAWNLSAGGMLALADPGTMSTQVATSADVVALENTGTSSSVYAIHILGTSS